MDRILHRLHILDLHMWTLATRNPRKKKWQFSQNLDLNPTCAGAEVLISNTRNNRFEYKSKSFYFQQLCHQCLCLSVSRNTSYCGNHLEDTCEETFNHTAYFTLCPKMCICVCGPIETQTWHCCNTDAVPECPPYPPLPTTTPPPTPTTTTAVEDEDCETNCFPSSAKVLLKNGKPVSMSELKVGDRVQMGTYIYFITPWTQIELYGSCYLKH